MSKIIDIEAYEILDSRGYPTIETTIILSDGVKGSASVPSGASKGTYEALELRDENSKRFSGKGVLKAIKNINNEIFEIIQGLDIRNQSKIDSKLIALDGTKDKSRLGANAILSVSLASAKAASQSLNIPLYKYLGGINSYVLPLPLVNVINGGAHATNKLDIQEFMLAPVGAKSFSEGIRWCCEVFYEIKNILVSMGYSTSVGDEGGYAPDFNSNQEAIEIILKAIKKTGFSFNDIKISIDAASTEFYRRKKYHIKSENKILSSSMMVEFYKDLVEKYPIFSIEDGMAEDDWVGWQMLNKSIGNKVMIIGDDLFVTNTKRLKIGINKNAANAILIKPNQIGTLSETLATIRMASNNNFKSIVSHRSGETEDTIIADLAVATSCGFIKTGSVSRSERCAKYNRLIKIEKELGKSSIYMN